MFKVLIKLGQSSVFYTFANAIEAIAPFLLAIIVTRLLSPSEYGIWVLFIALVTFLRPIVSFSLQDALRMRFYDMDDHELASFVWSFFFLISVGTLCLVLVLTVYKETLEKALDLPADWLPTIVVMSYFFANFYFLLAYNQFSRRPAHFLTLHIIQTVASLGIISALVSGDWGWTGIVLGKVLGLATATALGAFWLNRELPIEAARTEKPALTPLLKFGLVYLPAGMGLVAIPLTDRLIVTQVLSLAENGFYGVASLFGVAVFVAINGILYAWMPWLFKRLKELPSSAPEIRLVSVIFFLVLPLGGLLAYLISIPIAPIVIGGRFDSAFPLIPWAIAGSVAMGFFFHWQTFLLSEKAILEMSISSCLCIVSNAVFSYYGAIHFGLTGVFAATIAAFLLSASLSTGFTALQFPNFKLRTKNTREVSNEPGRD